MPTEVVGKKNARKTSRVLFLVLLISGRLSRSTAWSQTGLQIHTPSRLDRPSVIAIRSPAPEAFAEPFDFGLRLRLV
jgi:hypothetical protein